MIQKEYSMKFNLRSTFIFLALLCDSIGSKREAATHVQSEEIGEKYPLFLLSSVVVGAHRGNRIIIVDKKRFQILCGYVSKFRGNVPETLRNTDGSPETVLNSMKTFLKPMSNTF